jgi:hypothetical protein
LDLITEVKIPRNVVISQFNTLFLSVNSLGQNFLFNSRNNKDAYRRHTNFITANAIAATCFGWTKQQSSGCIKKCEKKIMELMVTPLKCNQQNATFPQSIHFYKLLFMFQAVPPPIIRSTKLYIQRQVLSNQYCCLLLSWMGEFHLIDDNSRQQYSFDNA